MNKEFKREPRYIVAKLKHLTDEQRQQLCDLIASFNHPPLECVIVESDWPNYEDTWKSVELVSKGEYQNPYVTGFYDGYDFGYDVFVLGDKKPEDEREVYEIAELRYNES